MGKKNGNASQKTSENDKIFSFLGKIFEKTIDKRKKEVYNEVVHE